MGKFTNNLLYWLIPNRYVPEETGETKNYGIDSSAVIWALAPGMLSHCSNSTSEYLKCKAANPNDPEKCLHESMESRKCAFELANLYQDPEIGCDAAFADFVECLKFHQLKQELCFNQRTIFETCAHERIGIEFRDPVNFRQKKALF